MDEPAPAPEPTEFLDEAELEALTAGLAQGDWKSAVVLDHHQAHQLTMFALAKFGQWLVQLELRTRT